MLILNRAYWMQTILKILILIANYQYQYFPDWLFYINIFKFPFQKCQYIDDQYPCFILKAWKPWNLFTQMFINISMNVLIAIDIFKSVPINISYQYFQEWPHQYYQKLLIYRWSIWLINIWNTPTRRGRGGGSHGDGQKSNSRNLMLISWYIWYIWSWNPLDHHHWMFLCSKIRPTPAQAQGGKRKAVLQTYILSTHKRHSVDNELRFSQGFKNYWLIHHSDTISDRYCSGYCWYIIFHKQH